MHASIFALNPPHRMRVTVRAIRGTKYPLLIVDDVYLHPERVREVAISLDYETNLPGGHPGERGDAGFACDMDELLGLVHRQIGARCGYLDTASAAAERYRAQFYRMHEKHKHLQPLQCMPHVDETLLAGVVYLNLPDDCRGGTAFYRHRRTGAAEYRLCDQRPVEPQVVDACRRMGILDTYLAGLADGDWADYHQLGKLLWTPRAAPQDFMENASADWERIDGVTMRWNRLVCYPGFVFHAPHYSPSWFEESAARRRLTQNLFFGWPVAGAGDGIERGAAAGPSRPHG